MIRNGRGGACRRHVEALDARVLLSTARFAVIGDYGTASADEADVSALVHGWNPDLIVTTGDNNYPLGAAADIDPHIGQFYHDYIYPYTGSYGAGATVNKFFPVLGNHDWGDVYPDGDASAYLNYFTLPGNERYYDFVKGPVHFFMIDSDANEPDGMTANSAQAQWLKGKLAAATEPNKVVMFHHPPYSSSTVHGSLPQMQWPFADWGATAVMSGHDHTYERLKEEGIPYFVNGLGGASRYGLGDPVAGSQVRFADDFGAMLVTATDTSMNYKFYTVAGTLIDNYTQQLCLVSSSSLDYDARPMALRFGFNQNVSGTLSKDDLTLSNLTTHQTIASTSINLNYNASTDTATFTFPGYSNGRLPDGNYRASLDTTGGITDPTGQPLNTAGSSFNFFSLAGDANRDSLVDVADLGILASNWQRSAQKFSQGDFNYDGVVDVSDLGILATNWQKSLAARAVRRTLHATAVTGVAAPVSKTPKHPSISSAAGSIVDSATR